MAEAYYRELAAGQTAASSPSSPLPKPDPLLSDLGDWYPLVRACRWRSGCGLRRDAVRDRGAITPLIECRACVERYGSA